MTLAFAAAVDLLADEGRAVEVAGARVLGDGGHDDLVLATADGWVVRFARDAADAAREEAVLAALDGALLVDVPQEVWTGVGTPLLAHRELPGVPFDADAYARADGRTRNRLAASVARLLVVLHSALSAAEAADLGVPTAAPDDVANRVRARLDEVPTRLRARAIDVVDHFAEAWLAEPRPVRHVLLHGGLHPGVLALTAPAGEVTGVRDFSRVVVGPPSLDLRLFARIPADAPPGVCRDLMQRVADQYGRTGVTLDVDGARAWMATADLHAAIETGDFGRFEPDDGVWAWPGADRG